MTVNLPITSGKMLPHYLVKCRTCSSDENINCFLPSVGCAMVDWAILPVVMCGNLNVLQETSQQGFHVTNFCMDTRFQSVLTLISRIVYHAVIKFSPQLPRLVRIMDWYLIHTLLHHAPDMVICRILIRTVGLRHVRAEVSHGTEAQLCHDRDVLVHCLAERQTRLHSGGSTGGPCHPRWNSAPLGAPPFILATKYALHMHAYWNDFHPVLNSLAVWTYHDFRSKSGTYTSGTLVALIAIMTL